MAKILDDFAFDPVPGLDRGKVWRWRQTRNDMLVGFLTPTFRASEDLRFLAAFGVSVQSLHYLDYLLAEPIAAAVLYRSGVLVQIPRPERFAIHKLVVADRRRDGSGGLRAQKDRMQATFLIGILLEDRPAELLAAYREARGRGPQWEQRIVRSLEKAPRAAACLAAL